jgi:hypothetical protein
MEEEQMVGTCSTHEMRKTVIFVDGRKILKWILKDVRM